VFGHHGVQRGGQHKNKNEIDHDETNKGACGGESASTLPGARHGTRQGHNDDGCPQDTETKCTLAAEAS